MLELLPAELPSPAAGGFTTRSRGHSAAPWDSANLGLHVGDDTASVRANRDLLAGAAGLAPDRLAFAEQVHGAGVAVVDGPQHSPAQGVDALVTRTPGLGLVVLAADCLPVLLADPDAHVVAAVHAGRNGLAAGVLQEALQAMARLGASSERTVARLGPAVCGSCYELPAELADEVERAAPGSRATTRDGAAAVDVAAGARAVLERAGVAEVVSVGGCTLEQPARFYSYRGEGRTGRHAGLVWLRP